MSRNLLQSVALMVVTDLSLYITSVLNADAHRDGVQHFSLKPFFDGVDSGVFAFKCLCEQRDGLMRCEPMLKLLGRVVSHPVPKARGPMLGERRGTESAI